MTQDDSARCTFRLDGDVLVAQMLVAQLRDPSVCYAVRDELKGAIERFQPKHAVLDMSQVDFVSSVGFLAFLAVRRAITDGRVIMCHVSESLQETLRLCRLLPNNPGESTPFELSDSVEAALAAVA